MTIRDPPKPSNEEQGKEEIYYYTHILNLNHLYQFAFAFWGKYLYQFNTRHTHGTKKIKRLGSCTLAQKDLKTSCMKKRMIMTIIAIQRAQFSSLDPRQLNNPASKLCWSWLKGGNELVVLVCLFLLTQISLVFSIHCRPNQLLKKTNPIDLIIDWLID